MDDCTEFLWITLGALYFGLDCVYLVNKREITIEQAKSLFLVEVMVTFLFWNYVI